MDLAFDPTFVLDMFHLQAHSMRIGELKDEAAPNTKRYLGMSEAHWRFYFFYTGFMGARYFEAIGSAKRRRSYEAGQQYRELAIHRGSI